MYQVRVIYFGPPLIVNVLYGLASHRGLAVRCGFTGCKQIVSQLLSNSEMIKPQVKTNRFSKILTKIVIVTFMKREKTRQSRRYAENPRDTAVFLG